MKFGLRNTSYVYPNGSGDIWADVKTHIRRAERDGFDSFWVMDHFYQLPVHGSQEERVGADHLCLDFAGNDPESYSLFVDEVMEKFQRD